MDEEVHRQERLWWALQALKGGQRIEGYFSYLEAFPLGPHNRRAAEAIERQAARLSGADRERLLERLRSLREPYLPQIDADSMEK